MNYYERHIGDFISDTVSLTMLEDGAYNRLLDQCYQTEKPLPADLKMIYRLARANSAAERKAVEFVLSMFFKQTDDGYAQKRVQQEIDRYLEKQSNARKSAQARWSDKHAIASPNAMRSHMPSHTDGNAHQTPDTSNQTPEKEKDLSPAHAGSPNSDELGFEETRLTKANGSVPTCPFEDIAKAYHEELPELPSIVVLSPTRKRTLQARWREVCASDHLDKDAGLTFFRDFFKRIKQSQFLLGKTPPKRPGERSFRADFDWIFNPANFVKIVEGRYHGRPH